MVVSHLSPAIVFPGDTYGAKVYGGTIRGIRKLSRYSQQIYARQRSEISDRCLLPALTSRGHLVSYKRATIPYARRRYIWDCTVFPLKVLRLYRIFRHTPHVRPRISIVFAFGSVRRLGQGSPIIGNFLRSRNGYFSLLYFFVYVIFVYLRPVRVRRPFSTCS